MNIFFNLPTTVGNGSGAPVDVSAAGAVKTIVVSGTAQATINVEFNNATLITDGSWQSVATMQNTGSITVRVACRWMRVRTTDFNPYAGGTTQVDVGTTDEGTHFAAIPVPVSTGVGAPVNVSAILGLYKTVQVGNAFRGALIVEVSEDGVTEWAQPFSFQTPGAQSAVIAARFMRVRRVGVPGLAAGQPVVNVGFAISAGTQSQASGTVVFANSNGVVFGMSGSVVTAALTGGAIAVAAGSQTAATGTVVLADSNGLTFGMSNSSVITGAFDAIKSIEAGTDTATGPIVVLSNSNGVSFGLSNQTITASVNAVVLSAGTELASTGTIVFSNSNGVSFGMSASTVTASIAAVDIPGFGDFGDGSDGTATMDGTTAVTGYTLTNPGVSGIYTATRETFFQNLTVNAGITVPHHGFALNVRTLLTNDGHIHCDGPSATSQTGAAAVVSTGQLPPGVAGGNGGNTNSPGSNGTAAAAGPRGFSTAAAPGGTGSVTTPTAGTSGGVGHGGGGGAALANGGAGGAVTLATNTPYDVHNKYPATTALAVTNTGVSGKFTGGSGGGGGAGGGVTVGGGGGASAGWMVIRARAFAGAGTYTANGGNGFHGIASGTLNQAGSAGGGGGPASVIAVVTAQQTGLPSFQAIGGLGAAGGAGNGTGPAGTAGGDGGSGIVMIFN
jgi:hypothetical protein